MIRSFVVGLGLTLSGCASYSSWTGPLAVFSPALAPTELPMRDALLGPDLSVRVGWGTTRSEQTWMLLDSGSTAVFLPRDLAERLSLEPFAQVNVNRDEDRSRRDDAVMIPELLLGSLRVTRVVAAVGGQDAIVGQSILSHRPWEIDWDRGRVTLGTKVWSSDVSELRSVPLRRAPTGNVELVTLRIDGRDVDFVLDTGARVSALPSFAAVSLRSRELSAPVPLGGGDSAFVTQHKYEGDTWLGDIHLGQESFYALPPGRGALGLLGLDFLTRFTLQIVPGERLLLRPRESLWQTARERVDRWPWVAACSSPACIRASLTAAGEETTLSLSLERPFPETTQLLLGCAGDTHEVPSTVAILSRGGHLGGGLNHIRVLVAAGTKDHLEVPLQPRGTAWFRRPDACTELAALDVVPLGNERLPQPALATLAP